MVGSVFRTWHHIAPLGLLAIGVIASPVGAAKQLPYPTGAAAYAIIPPPGATQTANDYQIGPLDTLAVTVFQEPDLTSSAIQVDAAGNILLPLIGQVHATGLTSTQLSAEIAKRLTQHYLTDPQVSVLISNSVSQVVTIDGAVMQPGVYVLKGRTTLIDVLAMAQGTMIESALGNVAVFRAIDGKQVGGVFDVGKINRGLAPDPQILGGDTVVVGLSNVKTAYHSLLIGAPLISAITRAATQ